MTPAEWRVAQRRAQYWLARMREILAARRPLVRQMRLPLEGGR